MAAHAFTAMFAGNDALVARAVAGLPGLAADRQFGIFHTWTQANEYAQRLNEGLGLTSSQSRAIIIDALLRAEALMGECQSLLGIAAELRHRRRRPELEWVLAQLELGVTFCHIACTSRNVRKGRLIEHARKAVSNAMTAMGRFDFSMTSVEEIRAGMDRLQRVLEECAPNACQPPSDAT